MLRSGNIPYNPALAKAARPIIGEVCDLLARVGTGFDRAIR
jgi:hypothetical protein